MNAEVTRRFAEWQTAEATGARPEVRETLRARYLAAQSRANHQGR